ncbi:MAG: site-2 protease family protein [Myxococcales bacterium]|nr:site-2 protease family protein [Myxococcales bacterium]
MKGNRWTLPIVLMALTFLSTFLVGAGMVPGMEFSPVPILGEIPTRPWEGAWFALPLMAILLAHEFGHFIAGTRHGVDISPPYFIPMPMFLLGTMGAVIRMRGAIRTRDALLDVGASGPLAGLTVALPVLVFGIWTSPIAPLPEGEAFLIEGRSPLYLALLYLLKGPIPEGHDIFLNPTAFAGWAGLLVTMINLIPVGQLDGGHVAYALFGPRQNTYGRRILRALPVLAIVVSVYYMLDEYLAGASQPRVLSEAFAGMHWLLWAGLLALMGRFAGAGHPPTEDDTLSRGRRVVAWVTLLLFPILFMPAWLRQG